MPPRIDKRILIVEDNETIRALLKLMLTGVSTHRLEIWEASDGEEGYHMAKQLFPDLAIIDLDMPVMNGIQLTRALRGEGDKRLKHLPIIAATGTSAEMQHQIRLAGANLTLEKPVNRRELVAAILTLLVK